MEEEQQGRNNAIGTLIEPEQVPFTFEAPGWTVLLVILLLALAIWGLFQYRNYLRNRYRREAIRLLDGLSPEAQLSNSHLFQIMEILKRVALTSYGRGSAGLYGEQWFQFLTEKNKGESLFSPGSQELVVRSLYRIGDEDLTKQKMEQFLQESKDWIKKHRV